MHRPSAHTTMAPDPTMEPAAATAFQSSGKLVTFSDACPEELRSFLPMPIARLPFHSVLVASENDPYMPIEIAPRLARSWGAEFVNADRKSTRLNSSHLGISY